MTVYYVLLFMQLAVTKILRLSALQQQDASECLIKLAEHFCHPVSYFIKTL